MTSLGRAALALLLVAGAASCGDEDESPPAASVEITAQDHADALTTGGYDNLFVLTLVKAPSGYVFSEMSVRVVRPDTGGGVKVDIVHDDANGDGRLEVGESVSAREPIVSFWDDTTVGQDVTVTLEREVSGADQRIAGTTWTPLN